MTRPIGAAIVGCGLVGRRRAMEASRDSRSRCVVVADIRVEVARQVAAEVGSEASSDWRAVVARPDVGAIVVATPNGFLAEVAIAALEAGKHVLVEKPMGRNLAEAERMLAAALVARRRLKVGFNHRYHPGVAEARRRCAGGEIGDIINLRCRYGHGGRPGYEREWRGSRELAGGGELTDQGVHVVDLFHWFAGVPSAAFGVTQTAVWPLGDLEDNAFGFFRFPGGVVATFHTSWTQWKNLFSFEIFGTAGAVIVEGLGRSYGPETLTLYRRSPNGGPPDAEARTFEGEDCSWRLEWEDFVGGVLDERPMLGDGPDGLVAMRMVEALYRSAAARAEVTL